MDSALRPRDIQARIRSGESAEEVAVAAGTSVEAIMPYASPVLAERAHVAWNAQKSSLRRASGSTGAGRTLGEAVELFLSEHRLHDDDVAWDAWRRPDGRWLLSADVDAGGVRRSAEFVHDVAGRYVVADNDDARALTGDLGGTPAAPAPRRLTSLAAGEDLPLGDDAIELVRDREDEPFDVPAGDADWMGVDGAAPVEDPLEAPGTDEVGTEGAEADVSAAAPDASVVPDEETTEIVVPAADPEVVAEERSASGAEEPEQPEEPELDLGVEPQETAAQKSAKRKGRASVPSWDEIMFGGGPES